jgi:hypothetical protein
LTKDDKAMLAEKTGLTKKQITGWFTNNRKRKYQKVALAARNKGKDISKFPFDLITFSFVAFVREIIKMKFDKDLDQSLSITYSDSLQDNSKKKR